MEPALRRVAAAITEWNTQHAAAESVVLLPVAWETHATPATGGITPAVYEEYEKLVD